MKKRKIKSIRRFVTALMVSFSAVLTILLVLVSFRFSARYLEEKTVSSMEFNLGLVSDTIEKKLNNIFLLAYTTGFDSDLRDYLESEAPGAAEAVFLYNDIIEDYAAQPESHYIQRFMIFNNEGERILNMGSVLAAAEAIRPEKTFLFPGAGTDEQLIWAGIIHDPLVSEQRKAQGLYSSIPIIRQADQKQLGRSYISVSVNLICDTVRDYSLREDGFLYWVIGDKMWRINEDNLSPLDPEIFRTLDESRDFGAVDGTILRRSESEGRIYSSVLYPIASGDLYLAEAVPRDNFYSWSVDYLLMFIIGAVIIWLMAMLILYIMNKVIVEPVKLMQEQVARIGKGDFSPNPALNWEHELGDVGRGINQMSGELKVLIDNRLADEKQKQELEYRLLQSQISPHFIYNALNSIKWMATLQNADGIAEMTTALSRLLRTVSKGTKKLVPLEEEIALLHDYITIQQYRYGGNLQLEIVCPHKAYLKDALIPVFSLQPLVENAIFHGIEAGEGKGKIILRITKSEANGLLIRLEDNGVGIPLETQEKILDEKGRPTAATGPKGRHIGLWNVHRRIQVAFGEAYGITVQSREGEGTVIRMRLPLRKGE